MDKIDLNTGQFIFKAGEKSDKVFLLLEGEVGIFLLQMKHNNLIIKYKKMKFLERWV